MVKLVVFYFNRAIPKDFLLNYIQTKYGEHMWTFTNQQIGNDGNAFLCQSSYECLISAFCYTKKFIKNGDNGFVVVDILLQENSSIEIGVVDCFLTFPNSTIDIFVNFCWNGMVDNPQVKTFHVFYESNQLSFCQAVNSSNLLELRKPLCICHGNQADVFYACPKCLSVYCKLFAECAKCGNRFIFDQTGPGLK